MKNPFSVGDRVSQGKYIGYVTSTYDNAPEATQVEWQKNFATVEKTTSLDWASPQPLGKLTDFEIFKSKYNKT